MKKKKEKFLVSDVVQKTKTNDSDARPYLGLRTTSASDGGGQGAGSTAALMTQVLTQVDGVCEANAHQIKTI